MSSESMDNDDVSRNNLVHDSFYNIEVLSTLFDRGFSVLPVFMALVETVVKMSYRSMIVFV